MGIFSKPAPLDPRFALPPVKNRECTELRFPCKSELAISNFRWMEKQMASGMYQDPLVLVGRILETSEIWNDVAAFDLDEATNALVQYVMGLESLKLKEEDLADLYMAASFGLLAGLFEGASKTTDRNVCHPDIWNAMSRLSTMRREERGGEKISDKSAEFLFICQKTTEAGYVMGKLGGLSLAEVFRRWNDGK